MEKVDWKHTFPLWEQIETMAKVLSEGGKKYPLAGWKLMESPIESNREKLLRHLTEYLKGNKKDEESGENPLAHVAVRALMLLWHETNKGVTCINDTRNTRSNVSRFAYPNFNTPEPA